MIDAVLAGVLGGLVSKAADAGSAPSLFIGAVVTSATLVLLFVSSGRVIKRVPSLLVPRFARSGEDDRDKRGRDSTPI